MKAIRILMLSLACALSHAAAASEPAVTKRLCAASDLPGIFSIVELKETPKGEEAAWIREYPYHYLSFSPGNNYNFVASHHKMGSAAELQKAHAQSMGEGLRIVEHKYTIDGEGLLNLYTDKRLDYSYRCMVVTKAKGREQPGDLLLTGYTKKRTELYKHFRRWQ